MPIGAVRDLTACRRALSGASIAEAPAIRGAASFFLEGRSSTEVARTFGHTPGSFQLTNRRHRPLDQLVTRYAQRLLIENALSDAVRFFRMNALSSAVGLKVDLDMALLVIASGLSRLVASRMPD